MPPWAQYCGWERHQSWFQWPNPKLWLLDSQPIFMGTQGGMQGSVYLPIFVVHLLSLVRLFETPWTTARQSSLSFTISWSLLKHNGEVESLCADDLFVICRMKTQTQTFSATSVFSVLFPEIYFLERSQAHLWNEDWEESSDLGLWIILCFKASLMIWTSWRSTNCQTLFKRPELTLVSRSSLTLISSREIYCALQFTKLTSCS